MRTEAVEDYLKAIFLVEADQGEATTVLLAERLDVSAPSVTGMLKKLAELKLVKHAPYHGVVLTTAGRKIALEIIRHHRLLELYLAEALGYSWDKVHAEAEKLEHHISEEFEDKIAALLGHPETDPHGDPIPAKDGTLPRQTTLRLAEAGEGECVVVSRVMAQDSLQLTYLASLGIRPTACIEVIGKAPFEGPLHLRVGSKEHHVAFNLARQICVAHADSPDEAAR
ncbi:MAG TPA: metal-dependent transcriptional regulator [Verrucomicrobiae bacterium]|nr:metal-dependent transcriptional regulator [Verrucomicrobiae bacterium]